MQQLVEAVKSMEDGLRRAGSGCLRSELIHRCFLSSLYEAQLGAHAGNSGLDSMGRVESTSLDLEQPDTEFKAMRNLERATALAVLLSEYEVLTYCAIALAELQISRRDLAAASATFDGCVSSCAAIADAPLRAALLQRLLPKSMEVCNMQGRTADSFTRLRLLNTVLALIGRIVAEECPICGETMTKERACLALGCGHSFHRDCCDCWLGRKMFLSGTFRAECPVCTQVDWSLKPTPAATRALEEYKVACGRLSSASGSNVGHRGGSFMTVDHHRGAATPASSTSDGNSSGSSSDSDSSGGSSSGSTDRRACSRGEGDCVESESSSCSGSSDGGEVEEDGADCVESSMR